ncbi:MAG: hypothetical protein GY765_25855, partial [bacterium]|nr:hypothetical protein [bacterium]
MYNKEEIVEEIKRVANQMDVKTLTEKEFQQNSMVPMTTVRFYMGPWNRALEAAGLAPLHNTPEPKSNDELLEDLMRLYDQHGEPPTVALVTAKGKFAYRHYGARWKNLDEAFLLAKKKFRTKPTPPNESAEAEEEPVIDTNPSIFQNEIDFNNLHIGEAPEDLEELPVESITADDLEETFDNDNAGNLDNADENEITSKIFAKELLAEEESKETAPEPFPDSSYKIPNPVPDPDDTIEKAKTAEIIKQRIIEEGLREAEKVPLEVRKKNESIDMEQTVPSGPAALSQMGAYQAPPTDRTAPPTAPGENTMPAEGGKNMSGNPAIKLIPKTIKPKIARKKRSVLGEPLFFRGLKYAPVNKLAVGYLFGMVSHELGFIIEALRSEFPDCEGKRCLDTEGNQWE